MVVNAAQEYGAEHASVGSDTAHTEETDGVRSREAPYSAAASPRRWPFGLYRVAGESMHPTFRPGDTLLGWRWFRPRAGQVVVATRAGRPLVKRIASIDGSQVYLAGDNPGRSTDSRHFGPVARADLEACILLRLG